MSLKVFAIGVARGRGVGMAIVAGETRDAAILHACRLNGPLVFFSSTDETIAIPKVQYMGEPGVLHHFEFPNRLVRPRKKAKK